MSVSKNLSSLRMKITQTARDFGRDSEEVSLIAVSKNQSVALINEALEFGQRVFGENRVQEAFDHWASIKENYPDLELHLIGPLQTNKVKDAVALFDCIQTVDREKLAVKLSGEMKKQGKSLPCFIQVNTGDEAQKAGILPHDLPKFLEFCRDECGLDVVGLMCIPPVDEPPALHFALLKKLSETYNLPHLSMGMSSDFEKAIPLGATYVRVGTGVFGERSY